MQLFSRVIGNGKPVLIIHGLFGMSDNWLTIGKRLAQQGYAVHLPDLRNHGKSPHDESHTYKDMGDDLLAYLDREEIDSVSVIGHSMGGKAAMHLVLRQPERITDLVVVDIAPSTYCCHEGSRHAIIMDHLIQMDLSTFKNQAAIMAEIKERLKDRSLVRFLGKNIRRQTDGTYAWKLNLPVLRKYLPTLYAGMEDLDALAPSPVRTLFIKGDKSDYITLQQDPDIKHYFPDSQILGVDAGHWLHAEQPDRVIEMLTAFLTH